MKLPDRLLVIDTALSDAGLPYAFGGAIALAYWTLDPRGTRDLDVNVFVPSARAAVVLAALPAGIATPEGSAERLAADGQLRFWWDDTPVDVFLDYAPVHADAARHRRWVPFEGREIPVLGPVELAAFKIMFDRTKDWADVEAMLAAGTLDVPAVRTLLRPMVSEGDPRWERLRVVERAGN